MKKGILNCMNLRVFKNILLKAIHKHKFYSSSKDIDNILFSSSIVLAYSSPGEIYKY